MKNEISNDFADSTPAFARVRPRPSRPLPGLWAVAARVWFRPSPRGRLLKLACWNSADEIKEAEGALTRHASSMMTKTSSFGRGVGGVSSARVSLNRKAAQLRGFCRLASVACGHEFDIRDFIRAPRGGLRRPHLGRALHLLGAASIPHGRSWRPLF